MSFWITSIGVAGVVLLGVNFILEASDKLARDHYSFILLYMAASLLLFIYSAIEGITLFIILNFMLVLISMFQLIKTYHKSKG
ncbi:MAG: hypothetical protein ACQESF_02245 [Nanobdellota archaeon]